MEDMRHLLIVVASKNPVKAAAIEGAFRSLFPSRRFDIRTAEAPSGVSDQPMSDEETRRGALNRVAHVRDKAPEGDVWAALEGGIAETDAGMAAFAWIIVETKTTHGESRTATFPLPEAVAELIRSGVELGDADDAVYGRKNSKQGDGAIGILTDGLIDRRQLYEHAAIMAMIPLKGQLEF